MFVFIVAIVSPFSGLSCIVFLVMLLVSVVASEFESVFFAANREKSKDYQG